jgi:hypothetical protein
MNLEETVLKWFIEIVKSARKKNDIKCITVICICLIFGSAALAGGDWSEAKITKLTFNEKSQLVFELEWVKENGFISKSEFKRFVFEFHNWPVNSSRWFHQLLPWTPSDDKIYPLKDLASCQNQLMNAFANSATVLIGQMGTVPFRPSASTENAGVVPFAKAIDKPGSGVCLLYAAPI